MTCDIAVRCPLDLKERHVRDLVAVNPIGRMLVQQSEFPSETSRLQVLPCFQTFTPL